MATGALEALKELLDERRGHANELRRVVERSLVPIAWLDNEQRCVAANAAARLHLRRRTTEVRGLQAAALIACLGPLDSVTLVNLLPGMHALAWVPAGWPDDEIPCAAGDGAVRAQGRLSDRERQVLGLLAGGASLEGIASELSVSPTTVKTHLRNAVRRLGARHRAHAIALALRAGELTFD